MRFADFLERVTAKTRKGLEGRPILSIPEDLRLLASAETIRELFDQAHVFNLGDGEDMERAAQDIMPDLLAECREDLPAPFDNMLVLCDTGQGWACEWHLRAHPFLPPDVAALPRMDRLRFLVDLSEPALDLPPLTLAAAYVVGPPQEKGLSIVLTPDTIRRAKEYYADHTERAGDLMAESVVRAAVRVSLISHPANHIVRTVPKLTPREERRRASKGIVSAQKKPHYIVIDYETLVDLNPQTRQAGTHRSPVPHARRGHWRRLAERCRLAKASGKDKIWVGETYVGDREFEDEKNHYVVFPDRASLRQAAATSPHGDSSDHARSEANSASTS